MATHSTYLMRSSSDDNSILFDDILKFQPSTRFINFASRCKKFGLSDVYIGTASEATKGWGDVAQKDSQQRMLQVVLVSPQVPPSWYPKHIMYGFWYHRWYHVLMPSIPQVTVKSLLQSNIALDFCCRFQETLDVLQGHAQLHVLVCILLRYLHFFQIISQKVPSMSMDRTLYVCASICPIFPIAFSFATFFMGGNLGLHFASVSRMWWTAHCIV